MNGTGGVQMVLLLNFANGDLANVIALTVSFVVAAIVLLGYARIRAQSTR